MSKKTSPEIHISKRADSGIYQAHVAGVRVSLGTRNRDEAIVKARQEKLPEVAALKRSGVLTEHAIAALTGSAVMTGKEVLEQWLPMREANGRSALTVAKDVNVVGQYLRAARIEDTPIHRHDERHVALYINSDNENTAATRERALYVLRKYYEFAVYRGYTRANPAANVEVNYQRLSHEQKERGQHTPFSEAQYAKLVASDYLDGTWFKWAVPIAYAAGLRIGDIACLEKACVTSSGLAVWTAKGRGKRRVLLPFDEKIAPGLKRTLASIPDNSTPYFFPEERDIHCDVNRRSRHSVYFKRILHRAGIEDLSFHGLRSTAARRWRSVGFTLDECKEFLGHGSVEVTAGYTGDKVAPHRRR